MPTLQPFGTAIIGASMRATMLVDYLQQNPHDGYITGIFDLIPARANHMLRYGKLDQAKVYASLEEAVADPAVKAVFVATPDFAHVEPVLQALQAGKHVYCEKPLAITLPDCDTIMEAARKASSIFYLGMNLRHSPVHETMHTLLQEGRLGRLLTIEANEYYVGGRTYFRRWNRLRRFGGGLWVTKACHDFDLLNWFAGAAPRKVYASAKLSHYHSIPGAATHCSACALRPTCPDAYERCSMNPLWDELAQLTEAATGKPRDLCLYNSDKDTFDNGIAVVDYANDVRASYTVNVVSSRDTRQLRLMGTEGSAEGDTATGTVTFWKRHSTETVTMDLRNQILATGHGGADARILHHFFHCCRSGEKPRSTWTDGRLGLLVSLAATQSSDTGKAVDLE